MAYRIGGSEFERISAERRTAARKHDNFQNIRKKMFPSKPAAHDGAKFQTEDGQGNINVASLKGCGVQHLQDVRKLQVQPAYFKTIHDKATDHIFHVSNDGLALLGLWLGLGFCN